MITIAADPPPSMQLIMQTVVYTPAFPRAATATLSPCSPADHLEALYVKDSWAMALDLARYLRHARTALDARVTNCGT